MKKALFISVHPDDETLGCGGTMFKLAEEGWDIGWLCLTDVFSGMGWDDKIVAARKEQIVKIQELFGISVYENLGIPTTTVGEKPLKHLISDISGFIHKFQPDWVFLPNRTDVHSDHRAGFEAAYSACKSFRAPFISKVFMYECLSETEYAPPFADSSFIPNIFIDITPFLERKIQAMEIYESEIKPAPFPRSSLVIEAHARYRGSRMGVHFAEAFSLLFEAIR
jgi:LmbE family N-acetylglucosaminyl deacetylase